jgi:hypothetical protein
VGGINATGTSGPGIAAVSSSGNNSGFTATGAGTGHGAAFTSGSGATGNGIHATAASTNGNGIALAKSGTGQAISGQLVAANFATGAIDANAFGNDAANKIIGQVSGEADTGSSANTLIDSELDQAGNYWAGSWLLLTSGQAEGQVRRIKAFDPVTHTITVASPFTSSIAEDDEYVILRTGGADVNVAEWAGDAPVTPNEAGIPRVDVTHVSGEEVCE